MRKCDFGMPIAASDGKRGRSALILRLESRDSSLVATVERNHYDVAIIGSGIAGSTLGALLARHGLNVVIIEAGAHPKFAVGESMILESSETLRAMAEMYDVPELAYFTAENYFPLVGTSHGVKRHFSYLHHTIGLPHDINRALQAVIPKQPHGHELHLYRQDSDSFLATVAVSYGCTLLQNTRVQDVQIDVEKVKVSTDQGATLTVNYIVDAGGFRSTLADKFALRDLDLRAHSRSIFTHMVDVPCYNDVGASRRQCGLPYRVSEGTLHHIFPGGWLWVIPFNNHPQASNPLCSVGLQLDPRLYPERKELSPEAEFFQFIAKFPSIAAQFQTAKAVRGWVRTGRLQYSSKRIVGDRYCLLGHAAGFIDPLYSKGLYSTFTSVSLLAHLLLEANKTGDYSAARFRPLEETTLAFVRANDRLVANSYKSFGDYDLWSVYSVLWLLGAYTELVKLSSARAQTIERRDFFAKVRGLKLVGGGFPAFDTIANQIDTIIEKTDVNNKIEVTFAVSEIKSILDPLSWMPEPFRAVLHGKRYLPANKLRPQLLRTQTGFLGKGAYRAHFFGNLSLLRVVAHFLREKAKYSVWALVSRERKRRQRTLARGVRHMDPVSEAADSEVCAGDGMLGRPDAIRDATVSRPDRLARKP